ncbi:hypothetical protein Moror_7408 [Moniliophthora roreri MCA 2997]|uniref:DUF7704 domain-containing protein n=1 Tax=Moniliophthora roreri (strain MCA 2997) TaxID=1381753 RepID=V2XA40_MONRO|nr:hypothetical protein Moror_7408 [Moniliophthora roreri MCA 2997]
MTRHTSAIPDHYYAIFAFYEPFLCTVGFLGAFADPKTTHDSQAPWPADNPPPVVLPLASLVTVIQLAHVCFLVGIINFFILSAARRHLHAFPALQEKVVWSLLTPLLAGDILHLYVTIWALGDQKWQFETWSPMLWTTVGLGLSLLVPRILWHLGIGRYVDSRDRLHQKSSTPVTTSTIAKASM